MPTAPPFSALYLLSEPTSGRAFRGVVDPVSADGVAHISGDISGNVSGDISGDFSGDFSGDISAAGVAGTAANLEPVVVRHAGGSGAHDFIWTDEGLTCISDRAVRTLRVNAITGWETFEVDVRTKAGRSLQGYAGLDVTGACGPLDFSASERIEKITPSGRGQAFLGRYFDRGTWDGSMMFRPRGSADIVVTERVRDVLKRAKIENIELRSLDGVEVPDEEVVLWRRGPTTDPS